MCVRVCVCESEREEYYLQDNQLVLTYMVYVQPLHKKIYTSLKLITTFKYMYALGIIMSRRFQHNHMYSTCTF